MALTVQNLEVERLAEEVARLAGETMTEAIRKALLERKARLARPARLRSKVNAGFLHDMQALLPKGRHPAALNFGDCLSCAVAKVSGLPLACVGDDFAQTDLS